LHIVILMFSESGSGLNGSKHYSNSVYLLISS
jgi:hypothetical protein